MARYQVLMQHLRHTIEDNITHLSRYSGSPGLNLKLVLLIARVIGLRVTWQWSSVISIPWCVSSNSE